MYIVKYKKNIFVFINFDLTYRIGHLFITESSTFVGLNKKYKKNTYFYDLNNFLKNIKVMKVSIQVLKAHKKKLYANKIALRAKDQHTLWKHRNQIFYIKSSN